MKINNRQEICETMYQLMKKAPLIDVKDGTINYLHNLYKNPLIKSDELFVSLIIEYVASCGPIFGDNQPRANEFVDSIFDMIAAIDNSTKELNVRGIKSMLKVALAARMSSVKYELLENIKYWSYSTDFEKYAIKHVIVNVYDFAKRMSDDDIMYILILIEADKLVAEKQMHNFDLLRLDIETPRQIILKEIFE